MICGHFDVLCQISTQPNKALDTPIVPSIEDQPIIINSVYVHWSTDLPDIPNPSLQIKTTKTPTLEHILTSLRAPV